MSEKKSTGQITLCSLVSDYDIKIIVFILIIYYSVYTGEIKR